jgi:predicted AlkP superfamily phosphohydrolase/phosphomutase
MNEKNRVIIVGLDGVPYGLIHNLAARNIMPNTKKLIEYGTFRQMESTIPEISSVAWSSIITGRNPGEHGIFGYTDIPTGTYRLTFPNFNQLKSPAFWQKNSQEKSIIINVPSTFPVKPMNGVHISGFVSIDLERSVYPNSLIKKLLELNYQIDVDASKAHVSLDMFLKDLDKTLKSRIELYRYLWAKDKWQTFMLVFTGTDRLSHFLWDAYEEENHRYHSAFLEHFQKIDEVIGEIADCICENDILILLSDHGFERLEQEVNINCLLRKEGYLKLKSESKRNYADLELGTKAFALEPARIYLNLKDKYPRGSVDKKDYTTLIRDLESLFYSIELNGEKVIKKVHKKDDIYKGPYTINAPDLVLLSNKGYNLKASLKANDLFEKGIFSGKHTQDDAFLLINRSFDEKIIPGKPVVSDVLTIIDKLKQ